MLEMGKSIDTYHPNSAKSCDLLHSLNTRLELLPNQNTGLQCKINSANHEVIAWLVFSIQHAWNIIRRGQRKTQTSEVGFWITTTIFIKQKVKFTDGCRSSETNGPRKEECGQNGRTLCLTSIWTLRPCEPCDNYIDQSVRT